MKKLAMLALVLAACGSTTHETAPTTTAESPRALPANDTTNHSEATGSDTDGDGLAAEVDLCPSDAEDLDGFEDADGCPDVDNDMDRIIDAVDQCPDIPETWDGYTDDDGCPDNPVQQQVPPVTS